MDYLNQATVLTTNYVNSLPGATLADKKAAVDYAVLTNQFKAAFPTYTLDYMITFGVYGLVASL